jgi:hypothetical protein
MPAKFAAMQAPKGSLLHNDDSHNFADLNKGGGPHGVRNKPTVSSHGRGGFGSKGQQSKGKGLAGRGSHYTSPNPGSNLAIPGEARGGAMRPESRIPGHGGSPQHREREIPGDFHKRGGIGAHGQEGVPGGRKSNVGPATSVGNVGGTTQRQIAGRFKRRAMGARATGQESLSSYGSLPVRSNT